MHALLQSYFEHLYRPLEEDIQHALFAQANEIYGELYYYSVVKLLHYLSITDADHFLDIGSGVGKLIFQIFLTTHAASVTGIEINHQRHTIASQVRDTLHQALPRLFMEPVRVDAVNTRHDHPHRALTLLHGDFLTQDFQEITIAYVCSVVFSFELLQAIGEKINTLDSVQHVVSFRQLPSLEKFTLIQKIFLQGTWDESPCYLYARHR